MAPPCVCSMPLIQTAAPSCRSGGNKTGKDKRFYKTMIPKADALYDEHLNSLNTQPKP